MYAYAYVFDRYAQTLLPFRYVASAITLACIGRLLKTLMRKMTSYRAKREAKKNIAAYRQARP